MVRGGPANRAVRKAKIFAITKVSLRSVIPPPLDYRQLFFSSPQGFRGRAKNCYSIAVRAAHKALQHAYRGRRLKKRDMRRVSFIDNMRMRTQSQNTLRFCIDDVLYVCVYYKICTYW